MVFLATFPVWFFRSCSFVSAVLLCCRRITKLEQVEQVLRREKEEVVLCSWFWLYLFCCSSKKQQREEGLVVAFWIDNVLLSEW